ncbi:MAG: hypothetical protein KJO43_03780 [Phycisphaerae bacterium]|nr:hypothetical protein [Phycisphaerae bacterium]NNF45087.1 hypothetical protein [Phycisphaerales bacterium]
MSSLPRRLLLAALAAFALLATPALGQRTDVVIEVERFGAGDHYRPGEMTGVLIALTPTPESELDTATNAWVQWEVVNADGDVAERGRPITLTKGQTSRVWLYAPLDPNTLPGTAWPVRVFAYEDGTRGRELGGQRIAAPGSGRVEIIEGMIGVIGQSQMGLNQLRLARLGGGVAPTAHEDTMLVWGLRPRDLPDGWEGLRGLEAIAWSEELPQDLSAPQVAAVREWIRRGGHLIISLPEDTNPWGLGEIGRSRFEDLLPTRRPRKDEDVPLGTLMPVLAKARAVRSDANFSVSLHVFGDVRAPEAQPDNQYEPLIALPDGRVIAIQRLFGHGRITLVGLDLSNRRLGAIPLSNGMVGGLPQADQFWNRILGRRADTPTGGELAEMDTVERLTRASPSEHNIGVGSLFRQRINMSQRAGAGLIMALLLFGLYWLVAGPGGFYALRAYKAAHHAWLVFAGAAALFTALAWAGVNLLRENETRIEHITVLDRIARPAGSEWSDRDPQLERAASWMSVYVPGYGQTEITIEPVADLDPVPTPRDMIMSWTPPLESIPRFPNADRYEVDVRNPAALELPARSTATHLYAHWLGSVDTDWGGLLYESTTDPIRVTTDARGREQIEGTLTSQLPGTLTDVKIIWVWNQRVRSARYELDGEGREEPWVRANQSGEMLNVGRMYGGGQIVPGVPYPLPTNGQAANLNLAVNIDEKYVNEFEGTSSLAPTPGGQLPTEQYLEMLSLYQQLRPPKYMRPPGQPSPDTMIARRYLAREIDLSHWFNRPCLIVIGYLQDSECPIPIAVNGSAPQSNGLTMVRWIMPLGLDRSIAFASTDAGTAGVAGDAERGGTDR